MNWKRPRKPVLDRLSVQRILLLLWMVGSFLWVAYWAWYFYSYCEFGVNFTCVTPGTLEAVFYSIPDILRRVFGPPALVVVVGLALNWAWRAYTGHKPKS